MDKTVILNVRVTPEFKKELEDYAKSLGLGMSSCVRMVMLKEMNK